MIAEIERFAREELLPEMRKAHPKADIRTVTEARVPALDESEAAAAVDLVSEITGSNATEVVSFGTDAGHFCRAGISTVVFGPGSIGEAHKPDEFIEVSEIEDCLAFLDRLAVRLSRP
jgi:acetylornithine deacetylase